MTKLTRPPVVAVLGHVDHGKTSLLDAIRKTNVVKKEFGGITQHIGAYQVEVETKEGKRKITFIDTPGHEAFSKMRSRGASVTDMVVLVVDATEGVKPQTEESLQHIKKAGVPFIVAATKMDLPDASVDRVKKHLAKIGLTTEGYGGDVVVVGTSSVKKSGIKELLEMILLILEMNGLPGTSKDPFTGVIIESKLDSKKGPSTTILVKKGILKEGEEIYLGDKKIRVKAMFDEYGKRVNEAPPSKPVEVLGFEVLAPVGAIITKEKTEEALRQIKRTTPYLADKKQLPIILKTDTLGSLEAILSELDERIYVVEGTIGDIGQSEILRAASSNASIIGFNVKASQTAKTLAKEEKVLVKTYTIIYELLEELYDVAQFILEGEKEEILGQGKIITVFSTSAGKIAGIQVLSGKLAKGDKVKLVRDNKEIKMGRIVNLKQGKDDVSQVKEGSQCGAKLSSNLDFSVGDVLLSIKTVEILLD